VSPALPRQLQTARDYNKENLLMADIGIFAPRKNATATPRAAQHGG